MTKIKVLTVLLVLVAVFAGCSSTETATLPRTFDLSTVPLAGVIWVLVRAVMADGGRHARGGWAAGQWSSRILSRYRRSGSARFPCEG